MEMICNITRNDETKLANALRSIYSSVVINESFKDQSAFLQSVILLVDDDIKYGQSLREVNPTLSYRISTTHELAAAFIRKYQNVIDKAGKLAYSANERYGYTVDIASVVGPYILYQCGITDENLSFYIALGMTLSNIICDILAKHEEKNIEQLETEQMATVCKATYHLLKKTQLLPLIVYALKDLRNAVAHNNTIFDARFKTGKVSLRIAKCISAETGINNITFESIVDYVILISFMMKLLECQKKKIMAFIRLFEKDCEELRGKVSTSIFNTVVYTDTRTKLNLLKKYL